jgi:hypothetical protein
MSHTAGKSIVQEFVRNVPRKSPRTGFAAYASVVRKYGFETETLVARKGGLFKKNVVEGVGVIRDGPTESEVPAEDSQSGTSVIFPLFHLILMFYLRP